MNDEQVACVAALAQHGECERCGGENRYVNVARKRGYYNIELVCVDCARRVNVRVRDFDVDVYRDTVLTSRGRMMFKRRL